MRASSRTLALWYPRLAAGLEAGLGLSQCLETMPGPSPAAVAVVVARLRAGDALSEALDESQAWLPAVDRQLILAANAAGRLPDALRRLAARHEALYRTQVALVLAAAYPLVVVHLGALAFPIQVLITGGLTAYTAAVARVVVPLWIVLGLAAVALIQRWRPALAVLDALPLVGSYRRARAWADLAFVLEAQLGAGIRIDAAWLQAAAATGDRRLGAVADEAAAAVQRGEPVTPALLARRDVPALVAEFYRTGEATGRLDEALHHIQHHFSDTAATRLKLAGMVYPSLLFVAVAVWVGLRIVLFYAGHFQQMQDLMQ